LNSFRVKYAAASAVACTGRGAWMRVFELGFCAAAVDRRCNSEARNPAIARPIAKALPSFRRLARLGFPSLRVHPETLSLFEGGHRKHRRDVGAKQSGSAWCWSSTHQHRRIAVVPKADRMIPSRAGLCVRHIDGRDDAQDNDSMQEAFRCASARTAHGN
jgi:hypothetical protein